MLDLNAALRPTLKMFLVKPIFSRYLRKFLVTTLSTEMTEGYIATLLSFQIFLISRFKFSNFIIFFASVVGRLWVKGTALSITSVLLVSTVSCLLKSTALSVLIDLSQFKIMLADSSTGSSFHLQYSGLFIRSRFYFKALFWCIIFASWLYLLRYTDSDNNEHPAITC